MTSNAPTMDQTRQVINQALANGASPAEAAAAGKAAAAAQSSTTPSDAAAQAPKPPAKPQKSEDEEGDGTSIDTFQEYQPSALPEKILQLCNTFGKKNDDGNPPATATTAEKENDAASVTEHSDASSSTTESATTTTTKLTIPSHTSSACESALLSSVHAPTLPEETAECLLPLLEGSNYSNSGSGGLPLSPLQLEGVLLAIQRHRRVYHSQSNTDNPFLPSQTTRAGFFLGDGAGIGKGRQISAMVRDSCCRGRTRHVWLSVSRELVQDAKRDLRDIGVHISVHDGTSFLGDKNAPGLGRTEKGCLFLTYNLLVSTSRLEQIIAWLAGTEHIKNITQKTAAERDFDGLIVFDEAHKAKNLLQNTKTAQLVLQLQRRLSNARVVYASATGVSDIAQLAYAERLGLWSTAGKNALTDGTQYADFKTFKSALEQRGLGSMELLALELKIRGSFLARTLSWEGAEFQTEQVTLDHEQQRVYDNCVEWFMTLKNEIESAFNVFGDNFPGSFRSQVWRTFWAAHQRFFKELAICAKVPCIATDALKQIEDGNCIVIGLQSTGDAGMQSILDGGGDKKNSSILQEDERFESLVSTVSAGLTRFVEKYFPVTAPPPTPPKLPPAVPDEEEALKQYRLIELEIERIKALPPGQPHPALMAKRQQLLDAIPHLGLPSNPLDDLIDRLGGPDQVAEMTGRPGRVVCDKNGFVYAKRIIKEKSASIAASDESERINLKERRQFMDGTKSVAIISDAASTGISLHAANGSGASHKRRVHYTIELPWSADKAVQQLGRSHRSGQKTAPIYKLVVTNLGGERRFAAAVSKRLASLGALTKGDRRAATGSDMSAFDLDSKYGKRALKHLYRKLQENDGTGVEEPQSSNFLPSRNSDEVIDEFVKEAKLSNDASYHSLKNVEDKKKVMQSFVLSLALGELDKVGLDRDARSKADVRAFLNRIAGIAVARQSLVFALFMSTLDDVIKDAKTTGEFEGTAEDITATHVSIGKDVDLAIDPSSGAPTKMTTLLLDRGISFEEACGMAKEAAKAMAADEAMQVEENDGDSAPVISNEDNLDGFIVDDDESEDEWFSTARPNKPEGRAEPGFYISKKKVAGRHYILFAKGKFDYSSFKTKEEARGFDPLGFMQISRPNTGTSSADMSTKDLHRKYHFACSCDVLKDAAVTPEEAITQANKKVAVEWKAAYLESHSFEHNEGLAPRRVKVALVNGPVLHILPALERAVLFRSGKDKSLKIMRANVDNRRIVGVRFPHDDEANQKLQDELTKLLEARKNAGTFYTDQDLAPLCNKSQKWATAERKTMKSFFQVKSKPESSTGGDKLSNSSNKKPAAKRSAPVAKAPAKKKTKTMLSFFQPKKASEEIDLTDD